jgi:hypothetical protein
LQTTPAPITHNSIRELSHVIIQGICFDWIVQKTSWISGHYNAWLGKRLQKAMSVTIIVTMTFCVLIIEMWLWAVLYLFLECFRTVEQALYFSISSFTTVGFGDLVLDEKWRLLSSIEAANGFLLFGWTTAFIFEIVRHFYNHKDFSPSNLKD